MGTWIKTACEECHSRCGVEIEVEADQITQIRGLAEHPISKGYTCLKGRAAGDIVNHPKRLL